MTIRRKNLPELLDISSSALDGILNPNSPYYVADFPKPIKIGARTVLWVIEDIKDYLRQKGEGGGLAAPTLLLLSVSSVEILYESLL